MVDAVRVVLAAGRFPAIQEASMVPGAVWSALLVALPLLAVWLGDSFPAAVWAAPVAGLLLIAAKVVEVIRSTTPAPPPGVAASDMPAQRSKASRLLWG